MKSTEEWEGSQDRDWTPGDITVRYDCALIDVAISRDGGQYGERNLLKMDLAGSLNLWRWAHITPWKLFP